MSQKKKKTKKRHKRGFTLIELLAVILILGIIALIALPTVNNVITTARKKSFAVEVQMVKREAEKKFIADKLLGQNVKIYCNMGENASACSKLELSKNGMSYLVELDKNGKSKGVYISNGQYCYANSSPVDGEDITFKDIELGEIDCSTGTCMCYSSKDKGRVSIVINNGQSSGNTVIVEKGKDAEFIITPAENYTLEDAEVSGGCTLEGNKLIHKKTSGDKTCTITLKKIKYNVVVNCTNCSPTTKTSKTEIFSNAEITMTPATNYTLTDATISGDGCSLDGDKVIVSNVTSDKTCTVTAKELWRCSAGTLTADTSKGASSGGYVCVRNASSSTICNEYSTSCKFDALNYTICAASGNDQQRTLAATTSGSPISFSSAYGYTTCNVEFADTNSHCNGASSCYEYSSNLLTRIKYTKGNTCTNANGCRITGCGSSMMYTGTVWYTSEYVCVRKYNQGICGEGQQEGKFYCTSSSTVYKCPSGWSTYSGSDATLKCYKAANH